jgi:Xaa-Pro aminopeptidase
MITMPGVVTHGRLIWDQTLFPPDEQERRLDAVRSAMRGDGLDGLLVFADGVHHADTVYLTQWFPMESWSLVIVGESGPPGILSQLVPTPARAWFATAGRIPAFDGDLARMLGQLGAGERLGLVGFGHAPAAVLDRLRRELAAYRLRPADELMRAVTWRLRPREVSAVRLAARTLEQAVAALAASWRAGHSETAALAEAEAAARRLGASDVRILFAAPGDAYGPVERQRDRRSEALAAYLAVEVLGYWSDVGVSFGPRIAGLAMNCCDALEAMTKSLRAGVRAAEVARAGLASLGEAGATAQRYGLGNAVGLSLDRRPRLAVDSPDVLEQDTAVSLRVMLGGATPVVATRLALIGGHGVEVLLDGGPA